MGAFFTMLFGKLAAIVSWFGNLWVAIFVAFWDIFRDVFAWFFEQGLTLAVSVIGSLDLSGITNNLTAYGSIPAGVMQVMGALGLGTALGIISSALVIRFTLQLIPFVRLGS